MLVPIDMSLFLLGFFVFVVLCFRLSTTLCAHAHYVFDPAHLNLTRGSSHKPARDLSDLLVLRFCAALLLSAS